MKKMIVAATIAALPLLAMAQSDGLIRRSAKRSVQKTVEQMEVYTAKNAIPEENGKVVFKEVIAAPGKNKEEIFNKLTQWASLRFEPSIQMGDDYRDEDFYKNLEYAKLKEADEQSGQIKCQGAEEFIFSVKPLAVDFVQAFYLLDLKASDGQVEFSLHTLSFNIDQGEGQFVRMTAENWITDKESFGKNGKLRRRQGKCRIKTIETVDALKKGIAAAINAQ